MPVFVFLPARFRASSAPINFRCFSVLAGIRLLRSVFVRTYRASRARVVTSRRHVIDSPYRRRPPRDGSNGHWMGRLRHWGLRTESPLVKAVAMTLPFNAGQVADRSTSPQRNKTRLLASLIRVVVPCQQVHKNATTSRASRIWRCLCCLLTSTTKENRRVTSEAAIANPATSAPRRPYNGEQCSKP